MQGIVATTGTSFVETLPGAIISLLIGKSSGGGGRMIFKGNSSTHVFNQKVTL